MPAEALSGSPVGQSTWSRNTTQRAWRNDSCGPSSSSSARSSIARPTIGGTALPSDAVISPMRMPVSCWTRSSIALLSGMSRTTAHVGFGTSGTATARITSRVCGGSSALAAGVSYAIRPAKPSHPIHFGSAAGGSRCPHPPAVTGSGTGRLFGVRADCAGAILHARFASGTTAIDRNGYRVSPLDCRRSSVSASASAVVARCTSNCTVCARKRAWSVRLRMRDCTRYELTLNATISPASRKNVITSSAGTTPTKTYERISLRRTRHSRPRLAQTAKRVSP